MPSGATNGHGPKRAVLYARVSTREQAEKGYSLRQQVEALRAHAGREGLEVVAEVEDAGYGGAYLDRPGLDRVRELVEGTPGGVSVVLAQDRDRIAREPAYLYLLREEFLRHGCALRALSDRGDDSPEGQLTDGILDQLAKYEREKIAERTRRGSRRNASEGRVLGAALKPRYGFGYTRDAGGAANGYAVERGEMATVRRVLSMLADGASVKGVAAALEADGVPAPGGGKVWGRFTVRNIAKEDAYRPHSREELEAFVADGRMRPAVLASLDPERDYGIAWYGRVRARKISNGKSVREPAPEESWVAVPVDLSGSGLDRGVVDRARLNVESNKMPSKVGDRFWELSGGLLRCADCGRSMIAFARRYRDRAVRNYYYRCDATRRNGDAAPCPNRNSHRAADLERRAWEIVAFADHDPRGEFVRQFEDAYAARKRELGAGGSAKRAGLLKALEMLEVRRDNLYDMGADGTMPREVLRRKLADLEEQERALRAELGNVGDAAAQLEELEAAYAAAMEVLTSGRVRVEEEITPEGRRARYKRAGMAFTVDSGGNLGTQLALQSGRTSSSTVTSPTWRRRGSGSRTTSK
jgi:site-specific DNA recombinase